MIIAALLLMQAAPVAEAPACRMLHGGIADGMCVGSVDSVDDETVMMSLLPAPDPGPPIAPDIARIIGRLLKAQTKSDPELPRNLLAEGAASRFCTDWTEQCMQSQPLTAWPLGTYYTPGKPYLLADGRVRIEWMLGVKLDYMSLIAFEGAKVKSIDTMPAAIPMAKPKKAPEPPKPAKAPKVPKASKPR